MVGRVGADEQFEVMIAHGAECGIPAVVLVENPVADKVIGSLKEILPLAE